MANDTPQRIFKIGSTRIVEDESTAALTNEQVRDLLKRRYPEIANATVRETTLEDGTTLVSFNAVPGRKG
mgnify:CR=1 FL=1